MDRPCALNVRRELNSRPIKQWIANYPRAAWVRVPFSAQGARAIQKWVALVL
jgi:hypothetical protein